MLYYDNDTSPSLKRAATARSAQSTRPSTLLAPVPQDTAVNLVLTDDEDAEGGRARILTTRPGVEKKKIFARDLASAVIKKRNDSKKPASFEDSELGSGAGAILGGSTTLNTLKIVVEQNRSKPAISEASVPEELEVGLHTLDYF